ncbi:hypothetical protein Tco_0374105 [Tanacetum coccineum]
MMRSEEVEEHVESFKTKTVLKRNKKGSPASKEVKETYVDDLIQMHVATLLTIVEELVSAQVINEVKNHAPELVVDFIQPRLHSIVLHVLCTEPISLSSTPRLSITNITILEMKEQRLDTMSNNPDSIKGEVNNDLYNALSNSVQQDRRKARKDSCKEANMRKRSHNDQDPPQNREGRKVTKSKSLLLNHPQGLIKSCLKYMKSGNKDMKRRKYALFITKHPAAEYKIGWIEEDIGSLFKKTSVEYDEDVVLGIITIKVDLQFDYRLLDNINVTRADKKEYTFKESNFSRLNPNDVEDMYVLKSQMSIPKIKDYSTHTMCPRPFGVVYEGRGGLKYFMRSYEVFKFCNGTLIDVRDQLKNMLRLNKFGKCYKFLNDREWSERDVKRSDTMRKKIKVVLKERRQMQRLERYVGGRPTTGHIILFVRHE